MRWLFEQVAEGQQADLTTHEAGCAQWRPTLAEVRTLWAPIRALTAERVTAPPGMVEGVMARVRELAREVWYAVLPPDRGSTRVAAQVIGAIVRRPAAGGRRRAFRGEGGSGLQH